jgi:hypothetical protein
MPEPELTTAEPAAKSAPAPKAVPAAAKESKPKTATKSKPVKKAAKPEKARHSPFANEAVVRVIDLSKCELKGKRGTAVKTLKDGMTVAAFKAALDKKDLKGYGGWALKTAVTAKAISVK